MTIISLVILAHLLGDFVFQSSKNVEGRRANFAGRPFWTHILVHFLLLVTVNVCIWICADHRYDNDMYIISRSLAASAITLIGHLILDFIKDLFWSPKRNVEWLLGDQVGHFAIIFLAIQPFNIEGNYDFLYPGWYYVGVVSKNAVCILLLFKVWPMVVGGLLKQLKLGEEDKLEDSSLKRAGAYIGHLERILIFIFIVTGHWEGVGFLLAAKSIFRYGDLTRKEHRMQTEYVLLGTLTSFIGGILTAQLYIVL